MHIRSVSIESAEAQELIAELDEELSQEYAPEHRHTVEFASFAASGGVCAPGAGCPGL